LLLLGIFKERGPRMAKLVEVERSMLNMSETAKVLGLGLTSTRNAVRRGDIPSVRIARRILIPKAAVENMIAGSAPTPRSTHPGGASAA
jgi:excisionase family DNA binding protein